MNKYIQKRSGKAGLPPGTLVHIGTKTEIPAQVTLITYNETAFDSKDITDVQDCLLIKDGPGIRWLNIKGVSDTALVERIGNCLGLHSLMLEDIVNTDQRPKAEEYDGHMFVILKSLGYDDAAGSVRTEQVSLVLGKNYVLSFLERETPALNAVLERLKQGKGKMRKSGADYLAYAVIDSIVDNYFYLLEKTGERIETLEDRLIKDPTPRMLTAINDLKREMIILRRAVWPLREVINGLQRDGEELISHETGLYLRDVYDHTIQVVDTVETFRDMLSGMIEIYHSSVSNKLNVVMKVLTVISTIFIPLTFIVGLYGMNFKYMPELDWKFGYLFVWGIMIAAAAAMVLAFRKRGWF